MKIDLKMSSAKWLPFCPEEDKLAHWSVNKRAEILRTIFPNGFSSMKIPYFHLIFTEIFGKASIDHSSMGSYNGLVVNNQYLNQWWPGSVTHICVNSYPWINTLFSLKIAKYIYSYQTAIDEYWLRHALHYEVQHPASDPAFSRGRHRVSLRFENRLPVPDIKINKNKHVYW